MVEKFSNQMDTIETSFTKYAFSLGVKLSGPELHWIKKYLNLEYPNIKFETYKSFNDFGHMVSDESDEFKIPFYSENPLIICEVNSILVDLKEVKRIL